MSKLAPACLDEENQQIYDILCDFDKQKHKNIILKNSYAEKLVGFPKNKLEEFKANIEFSIENDRPLIIVFPFLATGITILLPLDLIGQSISLPPDSIIRSVTFVVGTCLSILIPTTEINRKFFIIHVIKIAIAKKIDT